MKPSRLFHTLVICGAALTGGVATTIVVGASVAGCTGTIGTVADLGPDLCTCCAYNCIDQGVSIDFDTPPDLAKVDER